MAVRITMHSRLRIICFIWGAPSVSLDSWDLGVGNGVGGMGR